MWAVLDYDNKKVITMIPPDSTIEEASSWLDGRTTILMTAENSPAYLNGTYIDGKFYPPKEIDNG